MDTADTRHVLRRLAFTATPGQEKTFRGREPEAVVAALFDAARRAPVPPPPAQVSKPWNNPLLRAAGAPEPDARRQAEIRAAQQEEIEHVRRWWLNQMIAGPAPVQDVLALFFHGVLGVATINVDIPHALHGYAAALRAAAGSTIPALLETLITDPAMMIQIGMDEHGRDRVSDRPAKLILDNWTVGAGEYTDADVENLSRAITGWILQAPGDQPAVDPRAPRAQRRTGIVPVFNAREFDAGSKTILGTTRDFDARSAIAFLARHPATTRRYSRLMLEFFGVADPRGETAAAMARTCESTGGSIEAMVRVMATSPAFRSDESRWALIKSPVHLAVGACRQLEIAAPPLAEISRWLSAAGQTIFDTPSNGEGTWPGGTAWVTPPDRLLVRYQLPVVLSGRTPGYGLAARPDDASGSSSIPLAASLRTAPAVTLLARLDPAPGLDGLARTASPGEIVRRVMASPQYQLA